VSAAGGRCLVCRDPGRACGRADTVPCPREVALRFAPVSVATVSERRDGSLPGRQRRVAREDFGALVCRVAPWRRTQAVVEYAGPVLRYCGPRGCQYGSRSSVVVERETSWT